MFSISTTASQCLLVGAHFLSSLLQLPNSGNSLLPPPRNTLQAVLTDIWEGEKLSYQMVLYVNSKYLISESRPSQGAGMCTPIAYLPSAIPLLKQNKYMRTCVSVHALVHIYVPLLWQTHSNVCKCFFENFAPLPCSNSGSLGICHVGAVSQCAQGDMEGEGQVSVNSWKTVETRCIDKPIFVSFNELQIHLEKQMRENCSLMLAVIQLSLEVTFFLLFLS